MATKPFYIHQKPPAQSFIQLPNFLFEAPSFCSLSSEAKLLYAMILRRTDLSRKNGWADDYGKIYLYYPINEVCVLLQEIRLRNAGRLNNEFDKYGNPLC